LHHKPKAKKIKTKKRNKRHEIKKEMEISKWKNTSSQFSTFDHSEFYKKEYRGVVQDSSTHNNTPIIEQRGE